MIFQKTRFIAIVIIALCLSCTLADGNTVGLNFSRAANETNWGALGDYEKQLGSVDFEVEGQLQSGDLFVGNADLSAQFNIAQIGVKLSSLNKLQGASLGGIGRENTLDASLVVPIRNLDFAVGVFGANGNPFAPQYELSDAKDPHSEVVESESGITIPKGNRWGISIGCGFDISIFEADVRALLDPSNVTHQGRVGIGTGGDLWGAYDWIAKADITVQSHDGVFEVQPDTFLGITYMF